LHYLHSVTAHTVLINLAQVQMQRLKSAQLFYRHDSERQARRDRLNWPLVCNLAGIQVEQGGYGFAIVQGSEFRVDNEEYSFVENHVTVLDHQIWGFEITDVFEWILFKNNDVGQHSGRDRAVSILDAQPFRRINGHTSYDL